MKNLILLCSVMCICGLVSAVDLKVPLAGFESGVTGFEDGIAGWTTGGNGAGTQSYAAGNGFPDLYNGQVLDPNVLGLVAGFMSGTSTIWTGVTEADGTTPALIQIGDYSATVTVINRRGTGDYHVPEYVEISVGAFVDSTFVVFGTYAIENADTTVLDATAQDFTATGNVPAWSQLIGKQVCVRIQTRNNAVPTTYPQVFIDNVRPAFHWSAIPVNVSPADGAEDLAIENVTLQWQAGLDPNGLALPGLQGYYVYFDDDPNLVTPLNTTFLPPATTTYNVGTLDKDKTYYWQIEEAMDNGLGGTYPAGDPNNPISGVWTFKTILSVPVIVSQPQKVLVNEGDDVTFTVGVESISPATFKWFYSVDNANNTAADDVLQGSTSATLGLADVTVASEGYYYCVVGNDGPVEVASSTARLDVKRIVAWYKFENDITDSAGDNDGTAVRTDPNIPLTFTPGIVNQALSLNGTDESVSIPRSIQDSFTIGLWIKTSTTGGTGQWWAGRGLVDGDVANASNDFGTSLLGSKFAFGIGGPDVTISSVSNINDGQWHYCTATRDGVTGAMKVYVDGNSETTATGPVGLKESSPTLRIGALQTGSRLNGQFDEIVLYNYAVTHDQIAAEFYGITSIPVCMEKIALDLNNDCVVEIADFAMFASNWLNCNIYPQSECGN